jgi:signal transduction histidine kinase
MTGKLNLRLATTRPVVRYAAAVSIALLALLARHELEPVLETQSPYMVSLLGVFVAAWCCGRGPGLAAVAVGAAGSTLLFVEPVFQLIVPPDEMLPLTLFCVSAIGVVWITSALASLLTDLHNLQRVSDSALRSREPTGSLDDIRTAVAADSAALVMRTDQRGRRPELWRAVGAWQFSVPAASPKDVQISHIGSLPMFVADVRCAPALDPALSNSGIRSLSVAPLVVGGRELGLLCIGWNASHHQTGRERDLIRVMADRLALALDRHLLLLAERQARGAAENAVTRTTEVLAAVSHELRQPLGTAAGWLQRLRATPLDERTRVRGLDALERNLTALGRMVGDLLDLSRAAAGKLTLNVRNSDLTPIITDVVESVRRDAVTKGVALAVDLAASTPATVDALRIQQVVANLRTNAVKFTPPGGLVRVNARRSNDATLVLEVSDTGVGISPELLPRIFDRFEQSRPGEQGGLGLGLAIVRHLVELHGGTISAHSPGLGQGATFAVVLPAGSTRAGTRKAASGPSTGGRVDGDVVSAFRRTQT